MKKRLPIRAIRAACVAACGTLTAFAKKIRRTTGAVSQWTEVPVLLVLQVEEITGIPRWQQRPDIYPPPPGATA